MATINNFNLRTLFVLIDLNETIATSKLLNQIHSQGKAIGMYNSSSGCQKIFIKSSTVGNSFKAIRTPRNKWSMIVNLSLFLANAVS